MRLPSVRYVRRSGGLLVNSALLVLPLVVFSGCGEEIGPERFETSRVMGVIQVAGRPVPGGMIEIIPIDGTVGNIRSGPIGIDGSFQLDRVAVGKVAIGLSQLTSGLISTSQRTSRPTGLFIE